MNINKNTGSKNKSDWIGILKAASVYIGIITGAGFASGQELTQFFAKYGYVGIIGIIFSGLILALSGWAVMDICVRNKLTGYDAFMSAVLGKTLGRIMDFTVNIFICILFCAMLAGAGAMGAESLSLPFSAGVIIISVLCFIALLFDIEALVKINLVLSPLLVISGLFFGAYTLLNNHEPAFLSSVVPLADTPLWSGVIYASYNIITAVSVLSGMTSIVNSRKTAKLAGLIGGICLTVLGLAFTLPLIVYSNILSGLEIPMLGLAQRYGNAIEILYIFILFPAIFATAMSNLFAASEWLHRITHLKKTHIRLFLCITGIITAHIGFSNIVGKIYPVFGYIGIFEIIAILVYFLFHKSNTKEK